MKRKLIAYGKSITTPTFLKVMCAAMLYGLLLLVVVISLLQVCFPFITLLFYHQLRHLCLCDFPQSLCTFVFY